MELEQVLLAAVDELAEAGDTDRCERAGSRRADARQVILGHGCIVGAGRPTTSPSSSGNRIAKVEPIQAVEGLIEAGAAITWLNLAATFVFGVSGGLAAVRARLDLFGVLVLAAVVGLAGGITRDVLIGVPPSTFRDGRYLAAVALAGVVCFFAGRTIERLRPAILVFDALGLSLFSVTGATRGIDAGFEPVQAILLGAITGIGGGILRDVLLREVPIVLRSELYAVPALCGAAVVAFGHVAGSDEVPVVLAGATLCLVLRLVGMRFNLNIPVAPSAAPREDP